MTSIVVDSVKFSSAPPQQVRSGLLGWAAVTLRGGYRLDGIAIRKTSRGRLTISFPSRVDAQGIERPYFRPLNDAARLDLEQQILTAIRQEHRLPS